MQHFHRFVIQLLTIATLAGAQAQSPGPVTLAIDSFIEANEISGAVTLVAKDGEIVRLEARGKADMANNRRMKQNNLFWIASMTKPLTGAAILLLQDQGKLSTDDLVEQHLSEFSDLWLIDQKSPSKIFSLILRASPMYPSPEPTAPLVKSYPLSRNNPSNSSLAAAGPIAMRAWTPWAISLK
jgi:hypothetical protein